MVQVEDDIFVRNTILENVNQSATYYPLLEKYSEIPIKP